MELSKFSKETSCFLCRYSKCVLLILLLLSTKAGAVEFDWSDPNSTGPVSMALSWSCSYDYDDDTEWYEYDDVVSLEIAYSTTNNVHGEGVSFIREIDKDDTYYEIEDGLQTGTTYYFWIRVKYSDSEDHYSDWGEPTTGSTDSGKVSVYLNGNPKATSFYLDFYFEDSNSENAASGIEYVYSTNVEDNPDELSATQSSSFYGVELSGLQVNTIYYIWCRGVYNSEKSAWSSPQTVSTSSGMVSSNSYDSYLTHIHFYSFYFDNYEDQDDANAVEVVYSTKWNADPDELSENALSLDKYGDFDIDNLRVNTEYYFWFRADYGEAGKSEWSESPCISTRNTDIYWDSTERNNQNLTIQIRINSDDPTPESWELAYTTDWNLAPDDIGTVITFDDGSQTEFTVEHLGFGEYYLYLRANYGELGYSRWSYLDEPIDMSVDCGIDGSVDGRTVSIELSEENGSYPERWEIVYTTDESLSPSEIGTVIYKDGSVREFELENFRYGQYYFYVRGNYGASGYSPWSRKKEVRVTPPGFPSVEVIEETRSFWSADIKFYNIDSRYQSLYQYAYSLGRATDPNTLEFHDISSTNITLSGLTPRSTYYIYLRYDDGEESCLLLVGSFKTVSRAKRPDVNNIKSTSTTVIYNPTGDGEISWQVVCARSNSPGSGTPVEVDASNNTFELEDLSSYTMYYVFVRANFGGDLGLSEWSPYNSFITQKVGLLPECTVYGEKFYSARLSFSGDSNTLSNYEFVYTTDTSVDENTLEAQQITTKDKTITNLTPWATYYVYIRYNDGTTTGDWYRAKSFVAEERIIAVSKDKKAFSASISWNATELEETAWQVRISGEDPVDVNTTSYTFTGLTPKSSYTAYVRLKTDERYGSWSTVFIRTTENLVDGPVYIDNQQRTEPYLILDGENGTKVAYRGERNYGDDCRVPPSFDVDNVTYHVVEIWNIPSNVTAFDASNNPHLTSLTNDGSTENLTSLDLSGCTSLTMIGDYAFNKSGIEGVLDLSSCTSLSTIGQYAFSDCNNITSINLPGSLITIGANAFSGNSVTYVNFENGVNPLSIGYFGFAHMPSLKRVNLPNNLTNIGGHFLCGCAALESVVIPASVTNIEGAFLHGCESLRNVYLLGQPSMLKSADVGTGLYSFAPVDAYKHVNNCTFWVNDQDTYNAYINSTTDGDYVWARLDETNDYNTKGSDNSDWYNKRYYGDHTSDFTESDGGYKNKYAWNILSAQTIQASKWSTICFPFGGESAYKDYLKTTAFKLTEGGVEHNYVDEVIIAEFYSAEPDASNGSYLLTFKQIGIDDLESDKPYLIYMPVAANLDMLRGGTMEAADWTRDVSKTVVADAENNISVKMRGNYIDNRYLPKDLFYLVSSTDGEGHPSMLFKKTATWGGTYVPPYRCYFEILKDGVVMNNARLGGQADFSETTAIEDVPLTADNERQTVKGIYTISGQRLNVESTKDLPHGIYIVDGKKEVVK